MTESGVVLPEARIVYGTYGELNAAGDNAILLPSHYMADMHGYDWLIGPGKALDPKKWFLVTSELFGNGRSSSPSNTAEPYHGPRFPTVTIRDNVEAVHRLLTEQLHVRHLRAVIGFSDAKFLNEHIAAFLGIQPNKTRSRLPSPAP